MRWELAVGVLAALATDGAQPSGVVTTRPNLGIFAGRVTACPTHKTSEAGATSAAQCVCVRGRTGAGCVPCAADTFKNNIGDGACGACGSNQRSFPGSEFAEECLCREGFTAAGTGCVACADGFYKPFVGNASCVACPENTLSAPNAIRDHISTCMCAPGYTGATDAGGCSQCGAGFYNAEAGNVRCELCPAHSVSVMGSTQIEACSCIPGFTGIVTATGRCAQCPVGKFKGSVGESGLSCPITGVMYGGRLSPTEEFASVGYNHNTNPNLIILIIYHNQMYFMQGVTFANARNSATPELVDYKYLYPHTERVLTDAIVTSMWEGTFEGRITDVVTILRDKALIKDVEVRCCTACHANATSPVQSTSATACQCAAGFSGPDEGPCVVCPAGSYCGVGVADGECMANSMSPEGSDEEADCVCLPGFWQDTVCNECTAGYYCPGEVSTGTRRNTLQVECPPDSTSSRLSTSEADCVCDSGFMPV